MLGRLFRSRRRERLLLERPIDERLWQEVTGTLPLFDALSEEELKRLRRYATWFCAEKHFVGARGPEPDERQRAWIALQAALPVVNLGYEWLEGHQDIHAGQKHLVRFFHKQLDADGSMVIVSERIDTRLTPAEGAAILVGFGIPDGVMPAPETRLRLVDRQTRTEWRFTMETFGEEHPKLKKILVRMLGERREYAWSAPADTEDVGFIGNLQTARHAARLARTYKDGGGKIEFEAQVLEPGLSFEGLCSLLRKLDEGPASSAWARGIKELSVRNRGSDERCRVVVGSAGRPGQGGPPPASLP